MQEEDTTQIYQQETVDAIANLATTTASNRATVATLTATNNTLHLDLTACQLQLGEALQNVAKLTTSLVDLNKIPAQGHPTPEIGTTAGLMVIPRTNTAETEKNLEPGMTREQNNLTQKGAQIEINPADNGWELNIREKLQIQQHPSP